MLYPVTVNTCARHAHLSEEHMFALFGHKQPTLLKPLMQPGQYAGQEQILLIGPNGKSLKARVLGPSRDETQIEVSLSDARLLGIEVPVRMSGDLKGSAPITLTTVDGSNVVKLDQGVINSQAHIHMGLIDAQLFGLEGHQGVVSLRLFGKKNIIIEAVVRPLKGAVLEAHIDVDEANAAGVDASSVGHFQVE